MTQHAFTDLSNARNFANDNRAAGRTCRILKMKQTIVGSGRNVIVQVVTTYMVEVQA